MDRKPKGPCGTAVMFNEYALGDPERHGLESMGKSRVTEAIRLGGPNAPDFPSKPDLLLNRLLAVGSLQHEREIYLHQSKEPNLFASDDPNRTQPCLASD